MPPVQLAGSPSGFVRAAAGNAASLIPLSSLVYQSRAHAPLSEDELQQLLGAAQRRNRSEGLTGLLIYDQGRFLQWLEGPSEGLGRVWQSVRQDRRHTDIALLAQATIPVRFFGQSAMALGKRRAASLGADSQLGDVDLPAELIESLYQSPQAAPAVLAGLAVRPHLKAAPSAPFDARALSLRALVEKVIVPRLVAKHVGPARLPLVIDPRAAELARLLLGAEPRAAFALIDVLRADGRSISQLCAGVLEPAARALGDLWQSDDCSVFDVSVGLGYLHAALRRVSLETSSAAVPQLSASTPHAVLVAPSPHESHMLGSAIASEMFWRAGWDVRCEFPDSDAALGELVHARWFDVLDLSLSGAFTREHRLPAMAASVRAAHAHSLNPALTVIVDGRVFLEQPEAYNSIGADAGSANALEIVMAATSEPRQHGSEHEPQRSASRR